MAGDEDPKKCPCKKATKTAMIKCEECSAWWHASCVSLTGLGATELRKIKEWHCPLCYSLPEGVEKEATLETVQQEISKMKTEMRKGFNDIVESVVDHVDTQTESQTKKWSDLFKERSNDTNEIHEVVTRVVEKSKIQMDCDHYERQRRKKNVVVRDVKESVSNTSEHRKADDKSKASQILNVDEEDIENVIRAGKPPHEGDTNPRLLIITVKTPEMASDLHGHGRGRSITNPEDPEMLLWINPDLIQADRKANYLARKENQRRKEQRAARSETDSGVVTRRGSFLDSQVVGTGNQGLGR